MAQMPPAQMVWGLINAHTVARCLHLVADFGVAAALGDRPASAAELAASTGMNPDALDRMLRLLAAHDVFAREPAGYVHTDASRLLRSEHPQSLRAFARMVGLPVVWHAFTELGHAARMGTPATDWAGLVAYFSEHPEEASLFNQAMAAKSGGVVPAVVDAYDFSSFGTIADIGGGRGHLLKAILERVPTAVGILFDLPHAINDASSVASGRLRLAAGGDRWAGTNRFRVREAPCVLGVPAGADHRDSLAIFTGGSRGCVNGGRSTEWMRGFPRIPDGRTTNAAAEAARVAPMPAAGASFEALVDSVE